MKTIIKITSLILVVFSIVTACDKADYIEPNADFKITYVNSENKIVELTAPYEIEANVELTFSSIEENEKVVYWTGSRKNNYYNYLRRIELADTTQKYLKKDKGIPADDEGVLIFTYKTTGTDTIVMIATSNKNLGEEFEQSKSEKVITIK